MAGSCGRGAIPARPASEEPWLPKSAGYALIALSLAMLWRLFRYEAVDFSLMLVVVGAVSGVIWAVDGVLSRSRKRTAQAISAGTPRERVREPIAVEYARSFFPVIVLVLVIRSFLFEPFRIPSDSMMPTLFDGDFIFVSKYSYGLRLPVTNTLVIPTGNPQRGDVIVFRLPPNPKINYIKRLVGAAGRPHPRRREQPAVRERQAHAADAGTRVHRARSRTCGTTPACPPRSSSWMQAAFDHVRQRRRQNRRVGGARRPLFLHGRQPQQQQGQPVAR
jgi:signal peptidase I